MAATLQGLEGADLREAVVAHVRGQVARALGIDDPERIALHQGLFDLGMDSLMSIELKANLEASVGCSLPSTLTFNYPTIHALATYLCDEVLGVAARGETLPARSVVQPVAVAPTAGEHDDLTEDELAELLAAKLAQLC
jgi:acyl carrier protein